MKTSDTIVAPATPPGRGGVAIVRVSGLLTKQIANHILRKDIIPRVATFSRFYGMNEIIDEGIALLFTAPNSFTGEDILELQGHGGPMVVTTLIQHIVTLGARLARPGEFSERAFLNDKIDLTQAEAIADLIDATSQQAARSALRSLQGEFSRQVNVIVEAVIHLRMFVEAAIDFVEEEIPFLQQESIHKEIQDIIQSLQQLQGQAQQGSLLREGITVVIAGKPNVGKSSLLNRLSGKDSAIVTEIPGTTRDVLREYILLDDLPLHIIDTAGLRESDDIVEQEGIRRAKEEINNADILLWLFDASKENEMDFTLPLNQTVIVVRNKIDLTNESTSIKTMDNKTIISLSAKSGAGIDLLKTHIKQCVGFKPATEDGFSARRRHLVSLNNAYNHLRQALNHSKQPELLAEDLRAIQHTLNEITGEFTTEDLLGRIFAGFCIGK